MRLSIIHCALALSLASLGSASSRDKRYQYLTVTHTVTGATTEPTPWKWDVNATTSFPIHESCNATETRLLQRGLDEAVALAKHAKEYILRYGNSSDIYTKYFGTAGTGEAIGWLDKLVSGDRGNSLFRCDNIDGNCDQAGWGGHWRGSNATGETVICPLSYTTRKPLDGLCGYGYTVISGALNFYFASDLIHRLYHVPQFGEGIVEHYADSYEDCLELALSDPALSVRNTHTLQYFALEVYAYDISVPGTGCLGEPASSPKPNQTTASATDTNSTPTSSAATVSRSLFVCYKALRSTC